MRVMAFVKSDERSESGQLPEDMSIFEEMGKFNQRLVDAGVFVDAGGLRPSSKGVRVELGDGAPKVIDGPFAEAKELVGGYWVLEVESFEDAIEWIKQVPTGAGGPGVIELRPFSTPEDFGF